MGEGRKAAGGIRKQPLELALALILAGIVAVTFAQVLFRYLFRLSLAWSEELGRFLLLWLGALGSAYAFKTRSHFALTFIVDKAGRRLKAWIGGLAVLVVSAFLGLFIWKGLEFSIGMADQVAPSTRLSMAIPYSSSWVGGLLMLYYVLRNWRADRRGAKTNGPGPEDRWEP